MKKPLSGFLALVFVAGALAVLPACVSAPPGQVVYRASAPPPIRSEFVGVAPGPDFIWIRGYHRWEGDGYVWVPGRFERRPRARAVWVDGRWRHHRNGWYWVDGRWK